MSSTTAMSGLLLKQLTFMLCLSLIYMASADQQEKLNSTSASRGRTGRYGFFDNLNSNRPYDPNYMDKFYEQSNQHSTFENNIYSRPNSQSPYGYDSFAPSVSENNKYYSKDDVYYSPYSKKGTPNYFVEKDDKQKESTISDSNSGSSTIQDMVTKGMKVLTGSNNIESEVIERPSSFLSTVQQFFANPTVMLIVMMVPLSFLVAAILPYFSNNLLGSIGSNVLPAVTNTIASGFARSLDSNATLQAEQILDIINEYGAKGLEDPRCFQRFLCDAATSSFESRNGDFWSIQKVVQKLSKAVDDRLWNALGIKFLFNSVLTSNCDSLICTGTAAYKEDVPLMDKLRLLSARLFNNTEVLQ